MKPDSVLVRIECDLRRLPLSAKEAFFVSQLDGRITLEEASELTGMRVEEVLKLADRLSILGAVKDPSAKDEAVSPKPARRVDPRAEVESMRPPKSDSVATRTRRPSRQGMQARTTPKPRSLRPPKVEEACELDSATQEKILAMDEKLRGQNHYAALGVERTADKKDIKRAYFELAATFHPDRFFGKKLGPLRAPLDRVFSRLTEANDHLATNAARAAYDATLPPLPAKKPSNARRLSKNVRKSRLTPAVTEAKPAEKPVEVPPPQTLVIGKAAAKPVEKPLEVAPAQTLIIEKSSEKSAPEPAPSTDPLVDSGKFRRFKEAAQSAAGAMRAEGLIKAAEEALRAGDVVAAANNYRIALTMHDDPSLRQKLHAIDAQAREVRHEKHMTRARGAERAERWDEAAEHYQRANELRREAPCAERAAYALRRSKGDLGIAAKLGEQAVEQDGKNAEYRVTLGEVYLAAGLVARAKTESDVALSLTPNNPRAKALATAVRERS